MNIVKKNIPNAITCVNLICGVAAIMISGYGDAMVMGLKAYYWAYIFIGIAAVADFCDGFAARLLGAYSEMGKELDSLCDLVSFGVAPAMLLFHAMQVNQAPQWLLWLTPLIPVGGALRLARFNTDTSHSSYFTGLPIPSNAIYWIGFTAWYYDIGIVSHSTILISILALSYLMVSGMKMYSLKLKSWGLRGNLAQYSLPVVFIILVSLTGLEGFMWGIIYYIILSATGQKRMG